LSKFIELVEVASNEEAGVHQLGEMLILLIKKNGACELDRWIIKAAATVCNCFTLFIYLFKKII